MYIDTKSSDPQKCKNINIDLLWPPPVPLKIIGQRRPLTQQKKICLFNMFTSYVLSNEKNLPITLKIAHQKSNSHISMIMKTTTAKNSVKKHLTFKFFIISLNEGALLRIPFSYCFKL